MESHGEAAPGARLARDPSGHDRLSRFQSAQEFRSGLDLEVTPSIPLSFLAIPRMDFRDKADRATTSQNIIKATPAVFYHHLRVDYAISVLYEAHQS